MSDGPVVLKLTIRIKKCGECKHCQHTGRITVNVKYACRHPESTQTNAKYRGLDWEERPKGRLMHNPDREAWETLFYGVSHRIINTEETPPKWCPLRQGYSYHP